MNPIFNSNKRNIDVVILCGGLGTRLRTLQRRVPKALVRVNQRRFLDILLERIAKYGFKRVILCIGYKGMMIEKYYAKKLPPLDIVYSRESAPLGTGGALKNARLLIRGKTFLVMNGDTFCGVSLDKFLAFHLRKGALLSMLLKESKDTFDFATVKIDASLRIVGFQEKQNDRGKGLVSAGIYFAQKRIFRRMPKSKNFSLERDLFPYIPKSNFYGFLTRRKFIDIGTPQRYKQALKLLR